MENRIDSLYGLDINALTLSDICWKYGTGFDTSTGKGSNKKHSYRHGVQTEIGDIELSVWRQLAYSVIEHLGEREQFEKTFVWVKHQKHLKFKTENGALEYALSLYLHQRLHPEDWEEIKNRKHIRSIEELDIEALTFANINWIQGTTETQTDGEVWYGVVTEIGEIEFNLWCQIGEILIKSVGKEDDLETEKANYRIFYKKLLENNRVDEGFIHYSSIRNILKVLTKKEQ